MKTKNAQQIKEAVPQIDTSFLLSKVDIVPSARSTFTLTTKAAAILDKLSEEANVTQREVFDLFVTLDVLNLWALQLKEYPIQTEERNVRKTLVISRNALFQLDKIAKEIGIKRDDLACRAITTYLSLHNSAIESHQKRWERIQKLVSEAVSASINYDAPENFLSSEPDLSENDKAISLFVARECLNRAGNWAYETDRWEEVTSEFAEELRQLRTIAEGLKPIEIAEFESEDL